MVVEVVVVVVVVVGAIVVVVVVDDVVVEEVVVELLVVDDVVLEVVVDVELVEEDVATVVDVSPDGARTNWIDEVVVAVPGDRVNTGVVDVTVDVVDEGTDGASTATSHVTGRLPSRHRPVRGRFSSRVVASTQARARFPEVRRASLTDPVRHRCASDSIMTRVVRLTHNDGA